MPKETATADADIWADGRDSEAARAYRGEGTNTAAVRARVLRWMAVRFKVEASHPEVFGQRFSSGHLRGSPIQGANLWAARKLLELAESDLLRRWDDRSIENA